MGLAQAKHRAVLLFFQSKDVRISIISILKSMPGLDTLAFAEAKTLQEAEAIVQGQELALGLVQYYERLTDFDSLDLIRTLHGKQVPTIVFSTEPASLKNAIATLGFTPAPIALEMPFHVPELVDAINKVLPPPQPSP